MTTAATNWTVDVSQVVFGIASLFAAVVGWRIRKEQRPNAGSTMRDAVDRIEAHGAATSKRLATIESTLIDHGRQLERSTAVVDRLETRIDHLTDRRPT